MKILLFALFLTLVFLLVFGISRTIRTIAYDKNKRYLHIRTILAMVVMLFAATNVYSVSRLIGFVDWIINNPALAAFFEMVMPNRSYAILYMLLMLLGLNILIAVLASGVAAVINVAFAWQKKYLHFYDYTGFGRLLHLPWLVVNHFYNDRDGDVRLTAKGFSFGKWAKGFKIAFGALWVVQTLILAAAVLWGGEGFNTFLLSVSKSWYLLPMAAYFLFQQIQFFLEGEFYDEAGGFTSARITSAIKAEMEKLLELYRHHFSASGALLLSDYRTERQLSSGLEGNRLGNRQIHDCQHKEILEVVVNHIKQSDLHMNDTYKNALVELLNGNSVNICDHCEGEFLLYLCSYLNFFMSQGKTVLVLCPSRERVEKVTVAIDAAMNRLNSLCSIWNVNKMDDTIDHRRINVLVCTADEFLQRNVVDRRKEFAQDAFCTVLVDGFELFSRDCIHIHQLFSTLRGMSGMKQYVLFTEGNNDALRTAIERVTQTELHPFCHDTLRPGTGIMIWGEESAYRIQRQLGVGNAISPYMGTALPLAILAAKYDMDKVHVIESSSRADRSYRDVLSMTSAEVTRFIQKKANLQSMIRTDNSEILENSGEKILIAYDTECNFYHALWRWMKYGGLKKTLVHIISPSYLLREYFVAKYHEGDMLLRNNDFDPLISYHQGMNATRMAVLLVTLCKQDMTERELMEKSREYGWNYQSVVELLEDCLKVVLTDHEIHNIYSSFMFKKEKGFVCASDCFEDETYVSLTDDVIRKRLEQKAEFAQLVSQNDQRTPLPILRGNALNYYLRDQIVPINGYFYHIRAVDNGNVYAEQKNHSDAPEYMPLCDFEFSDYTRVDSCVDSTHLDLNICTANVRRKIYGYWETTRSNRFGEGEGLMLHDLRGDRDGVIAEYERVGILEINIPRTSLGADAVETARLFAYTLKELCRTLFPHSYQNLFVAMREEDATSYAKAVFAPGEHSLDDKAASLIPTVAPGFDEPRGDVITLYVIEASCLEYGMVQMLYERRIDVFRMLREYLEWYQQSLDGRASLAGDATPENTAPTAPKPVCGSYLHFGGESIPRVFSLSGLLALCHKIAPVTSMPTAGVEETVTPQNVSVCSFCGALTMMPIELQEGTIRRVMCRECADHQCTAEDEVNTLYKNVFDSMQRDYNIHLPGNLTIRFQTADAIAKFTGVGGDDGRVLGFYYHAGRQLWLEARGPEVALRSTIFHELTHAWQHNDHAFSEELQRVLRRFKRKYRNLVRLLLVEGHATYTEIDGMWEHHELVFADRHRQATEERQDEYGIGYRFVRDYLEEYRTEGSHMTPFTAMIRLLEDIVEGKEPKDKLLEIVQNILDQ